MRCAAIHRCQNLAFVDLTQDIAMPRAPPCPRYKVALNINPGGLPAFSFRLNIVIGGKGWKVSFATCWWSQTYLVGSFEILLGHKIRAPKQPRIATYIQATYQDQLDVGSHLARS